MEHSTATAVPAPTVDTELQIGVETFGDISTAPDGGLTSHAQVVRDVVAEAVAADRVGLDFFGVGEHHRDDYAVSAPDVVLAAIAQATERIRMGSAVTVLSSDDPVRVFERFATVDALSNHRAEIIAGRGSFIESFPLFGYDLRDYEDLFEEKLDLLAKLLQNGPVAWEGKHRRPLPESVLYPTIEDGQKLFTWVGVGGSPQSVIRAARHGLPLLLAIIGGDPMAFKPMTGLYRRALAELGQAPQPIGAHVHGFVAESDEEALTTLWPHYRATMDRIGADRGWPPFTRGQFMAAAEEDGNLAVGSPETVAKKLASIATGLGLARLDVKYSAGTLPHADNLRSIELLGTEVKPRVLEIVGAQRQDDAAEAAKAAAILDEER